MLAIILLAAFLRLSKIGSLPPGDGYDPAWYGVDALQILRGHLPVYLPTNIGREAMFSYLVALSVAVFGIGPAAIHIAAAIVGVLTVPATFLAADALFARERGLLRGYGGLVSALMVTVSFWHQNWSRYGVRAILVPLFAALTLWALVRAVRTQRWRSFVLTGILLGLSFYTYQSARVLPALVIWAFVVLMWAEHRTPPWRAGPVRQLLVVAAASVVVVAPMGIYLATHPGIGSERIDQTWVIDPDLGFRDNALRVRNEIVDAFNVFVVEGDQEPIHNLPGRPAMNGFLVALTVVGLIVALARLRRPPYAIVLAWIPVMSITAILTLGGQPTKRALGALPAVAMLVAAGALVPLDQLNRATSRRDVRAWRGLAILWVVAVAAGFGYSGFSTYRDYFVVWGSNPKLFTHFEAGRDAIGHYAGTLPPDEVVYSSPEMPDHPSIVYNSGARPGMKGYNGRICFVYPEETQRPTTYIIVQHEEGNSLDLLAHAYPDGEAIGTGPDYYGQPYFTAYRVPQGAAAQLQPAHPIEATWEDTLRLTGYDLSAERVHPGETLQVTLSYGAVGPVDRNWIVFVHLMGASENPATGNALWAQSDGEPCQTFYPTSVWSEGEIVRDTFTLTVPDDAPPGTYMLEMGFYTWPDMDRLTTASGPDGTPQIAFTFGEVAVQ